MKSHDHNQRTGRFKRGNAAAAKVPGGFAERIDLNCTAEQKLAWESAARAASLGVEPALTVQDWIRQQLDERARMFRIGTAARPGG